MLQQFFPKLSIPIKYSMKSESSEMELNVTSETLSDESDVDLEFNNHSLGFEEGDVVTAVPLEDSNAEIKSEKSESELNVTSETLSDDSDVDLEFNNNSLGFMEGGDFDQDDDNAPEDENMLVIITRVTDDGKLRTTSYLKDNKTL